MQEIASLKDEKAQLHEKITKRWKKKGASPSCRYKREMKLSKPRVRQKKHSRRSGAHCGRASSGGAVPARKA